MAEQSTGTALSAIVLTARATALMVDQGGDEPAEALKAAVLPLTLRVVVA